MEQKSEDVMTDIALDDIDDPNTIDTSSIHPQTPKPSQPSKSKISKKIINKLLSIKNKIKNKSESKPISKSNTNNTMKPTMTCITPVIHQNFQSWNINVSPIRTTKTETDLTKSPSSNSSNSNDNISKNTEIVIGIYELPSIKSFGFEFKFAPYYYLGYGFYGNPYDKNSKQCNQKPIKQVIKSVNIYDKLAISLNKEKNEIIIWRNGVMDNDDCLINIKQKKEYQFIIESLDENYQIKVD